MGDERRVKRKKIDFYKVHIIESELSSQFAS
jgi:hypothetical protein